MRKPHVSRRLFLKSLGLTAVGLGVVRLENTRFARVQEQALHPIYLPLLVNTSLKAALRGKVVHIHAPRATNWNFNSALYYGKTQAPGVLGVDQGVVDAMVDRGVTGLLGLPGDAVAQAWALLIPDYTPGEVVAIKINLNNSAQSTCASTTSAIDAIAQPVNAVVRGLKLRSVRDQDIVVYDAVRSFPNRIYKELVYRNIQIHDYSGCQGIPTTWNSGDADAKVKFTPPSGSIPSVRLCDSLVNASYLINMPILKGHPLAGVTLGFKNHFGSTDNPAGMHNYVSTSYAQIDRYNGLVDLYSNPHICGKTVLTIGDGIYGSRMYQDTPPQPWKTFNNQSPCSLFFAIDPVAIDCVMHDLLKAERGSSLPASSNAYLKLAEKAGLGVFGNGSPWQLPFGSGYARIIYHRIEL
jgi:uncharacterized protein (DUF362 family)